MKPTFHPLRVARVERLTTDAVAVTFEVPPQLRSAYAFQPGQHVTVRTPQAGDDTRRNYSIASTRELRIGVKRIPGGGFSGYALERMRPGDVVDVMTPTGRFRVQPDPAEHRRIVAVAAGSGITPILAIVRAVLETEPASEAVLLVQNRSVAEVMFLEELADLKDLFPDRFQLIHILSGEQPDIELFAGRIDGDKMKRLLDTVIPQEQGVHGWYLCGPQPMVRELRGVLSGRGVPLDRIHSELFHASVLPASGSDGSDPAAGTIAGAGAESCDVTAILDGRRSTFRLPANGPVVLEGMLDVRTDAPFACRGGVCGTCRAKVIQGEVRMDQCYALEPAEVAAGYVLTCQSHPTTERLVVDYDV